MRKGCDGCCVCCQRSYITKERALPHPHPRQQVVKEMVLADVMEDKVAGEVMDLQHAGAFLPAKISKASADYSETANSDVVIITAGVRQQVGETRYACGRAWVCVCV
jgi:hypothetical protein